jgi:signal transduction histidine kinase
LLDATAVESRTTAIQEGPFAPRPLFEEVASLLRPLAELKGLDLRVEIEHQTPLWMTGDIAKIRQVLLSVAHNAIRFTEAGFVELRCWRLGPDHVAFQVQDTGPGIPASVSRRISTGFVRADGTAWHRYHGEQIGLSISKRLVELMGGRLVFHIETLQGTTVRVELPTHGLRSSIVASQPLPSRRRRALRVSQ